MSSACGLTSLSPGDARLLGRELVGGSFHMGSLSALAAGQARFFGSEAVRRALAMCCAPTPACYLPLLIAVHSSKSSSLSFRHGLVLSCAGPRTN
jgi:hypothetical protein